MPENTYVLEMKDICKDFPGVKALNKAQFRLRHSTVHALMGENGAGKSTLMKCLFGVYTKDSGEIFIDGHAVQFFSPRQAMENGVSMVHQELNQVLQRNVMDNMWLGRYPSSAGVVSEKAMYERTKKVFDDLNIHVNPKMKMGSLSVSQRQMVEIAKAVSYEAKILVLDEPTSSLTEKEVEHLFRIINLLKDKGCGIIYISHKMEEILKISDDVTIMRDGKWVSTESAADLTTDKIINLMVGRDLTNRFPPKTNVPGKVILEVKELSAAHRNLHEVSFSLRAGEILGVAGLQGAGRTELLETIFGISQRSGGEILLNNKPIANRDSASAIQNGFALLTEERRSTGIFGGLDIKFNSMIANIQNYSKWGVLDDRKITKDTDWVIRSMKVKTPGQKTLIRTLSGGNQQKVIIGRWLLTEPEILLLDEPTRGIDVGAKFEIYQLIVDLANKGKGILVVSSEMPELLGITDRILVMSNGRVGGIANTNELNQEEILRLAATYI